jgi:hypothetical protein
VSTKVPRIAITLSPSERDALRELAHDHAEPLATTAGRLLRAALADHGAQLETPPARRTGPPARRRPRRAPAASAPAEAIDTLLRRYPHDFQWLPDLDGDPLAAEQLAALAAWRHQLDEHPPEDPRMELAFGHAARDLGRWLQERSRRIR